MVKFPYKTFSEVLTLVVLCMLRDILEQERGTCTFNFNQPSNISSVHNGDIVKFSFKNPTLFVRNIQKNR